MSEEYKITAGTISGATLKSIDIEPSIIVDGKSYTTSEFNKAIEMLKQPQLDENQQIVIDLEISDCSVEVAGWNYPEELDTENIRYLFGKVLENARALELGKG